MQGVKILAQGVYTVHAKRNLIDHAKVDLGRAPGGEHQLVMLARIARHEHNGAAVFAVAAIRHHELQHAGVKIDHLVHISNKIPDVAECQ